MLGQKDEARRSKIDDVHRREAAALKALFEDYQAEQAKKGVKITQSGFAVDAKLGTTQGLVWQYLNARIPLNLKAGLRFAEALGVKLDQFSPRLAEEQARLAPAEKRKPRTILESVLELSPMELQLLGLYRELKPEQQNDLLLKANDMHAATHHDPSPANPFPAAPKKRTKEKVER